MFRDHDRHAGPAQGAGAPNHANKPDERISVALAALLQALGLAGLPVPTRDGKAEMNTAATRPSPPPETYLG